MKLMWKELIIIYLAEFIVAIYLLHLYGYLDPTKAVNDLVVGLVVGIVIIVITVHLTSWYTRKDKEVDQKKEEEIKKKEKLEQEEAKKREKLEQERNKRREELNGYIHEHNQKLIDAVIKPWHVDKFVSKTKEPIAIEHLRTGYPNIWKLWFEECKGLQGCISEDKKKIKEYIKNKSSMGIPSYAELEDVFDDDNYIFKIDKEKFGGVSVGRTTERVIGYLDYFSRKGKFPKVGGSKEIIETIMKDPPLYERFKNVDKNTKLLNKKSNEFGQGLKEIVDDFKERHIELKGTCKDCKEWQGELKSLK